MYPWRRLCVVFCTGIPLKKHLRGGLLPLCTHSRPLHVLNLLRSAHSGPWPLHNAIGAKALIEELKKSGVSANAVDDDGCAPIHAIVQKKFKSEEEKMKLLVALLTYSDADVNLRMANGSTALHLAAQACDLDSSSVLLAFGANVNAKDSFQKTPLDLTEGLALFPAAAEHDQSIPSTSSNSTDATAQEKYVSQERLSKLLRSVGAERGRKLQECRPKLFVPFLGDEGAKDYTALCRNEDWFAGRYREIESSIEQRLTSNSKSCSFSASEAMSLALEMRELRKYKKAGSRILFLDGGGMRGLILVEILSQIERATGRRITELFDWIVGTSTGGVIALSLVYANVSLQQVRQVLFRTKDEVFGKSRAGMAYNTDGLERILKQVGENCMLNHVKYPRVLIPAVSKETINLELHFFNNCFGDEFSTQPVWKVGRYTSAAPLYFTEFEGYVDGGVLANNPCEAGLTKIQDSYRKRGKKLPISLVASIGGGIYPKSKLGRTDAQDFLFLGPHWFDFSNHLTDRVKNLMTLLSNAIAETEVAAETCKSRCNEQGIPFYRFTPELNEMVITGETDSRKLVNMILETRVQVSQRLDFNEMIENFYEAANVHSEMNHRN